MTCRSTHHEGCSCHEAAWRKRVEDMRLRAIKAECEVQALKKVVKQLQQNLNRATG